jgi:uncharacterized protein (TIGR04255 family)
MRPDCLPKFERPPVIETVLGVQFTPLPEFRNAHLGAFWKRLGPEWPNVSDAPPLPPHFERFAETDRWTESGLKLTIGKDPNVRIQIRNAKKDRMLQVQNGRFLYNWVGEGGSQYPRYEAVRPEFDRLLGQFKVFLADEGLGALTEDQWEVTYVNHIPQGSVWNSVDEWAEVFRPVATLPISAGNARLTNLGGEWHYEIEPKMGRLYVRLQHGRKTPHEGPELLIVTFTARGPLIAHESGDQGLSSALDLGHETIVRAFRDLTTEKAHKYWGEICDK